MRPPVDPSRSRPALVAAAALVVLVALLLVLRGGGDDGDGELRIVRGAPGAGFPLRGAAAGDEATIREAAEAWVRKARREHDDWADASSLDVTVLWSGPLSKDADGVVLVSGRTGAVLERGRGRDYWQVGDAVVDEAKDPVVVAGRGAVLVRADAEASFLTAEARRRADPEVRQDDGLWHRGASDLPTGALLLPDGLPSRFRSGSADLPPAAVFAGGDGGSGRPQVRRLSPRLLRRLELDGTESTQRTDLGDEARKSAQRLVAAATRAGAPAEDETPAGSVTSPPELDLVAERILQPLGPVVVLSASAPVVGSGREDRRSRLVAAAGGTTVAGRDDAVTAIPLGGGAIPLRAPTGPAFGAAYVRREVRPDDPGTSADDDAEPRIEGPWLLVAGDEDVTGVEVRAGRRTLRVPTPLGLVRASWLPDGDDRRAADADVAILGRTADGSLVVPSTSDGRPQAVQARE